MDLIELLENIRKKYLSGLTDMVQHARLHESLRAMPEVLFDFSNGAPDRIYALRRVDLAYLDPGAPPVAREAVFDDVADFGVVTFNLTIGDGADERKAKMSLHSFKWSQVDLLIHGTMADWEPFEQCARKWLDPDDARHVPGRIFQEVIHRVDLPNQREGLWHTTIDLGSSPGAAFLELLGALAEGGASAIEAGTYGQS